MCLAAARSFRIEERAGSVNAWNTPATATPKPNWRARRNGHFCPCHRGSSARCDDQRAAEGSRAAKTELLAGHILVNHEPSRGERRKQQTENDVSGVRSIVRNVETFHHRDRKSVV